MTSPWPDALVTYRKRQRQKFKLYLTKGVQVNPKAYCCDDNTINDQKPPVAMLTVTPNPIYEGENATLDLTGSYDPDGAGIADPAGYELWDGLGVNYPGTKTQVVNYPNAGRYECIGVVVDADGFYGQASVWIEVLDSPSDPDPVNPPEPPGDWRKSIYLATKVDGIFFTEDFTEPGGADPEWAQVNTGLGTNNTRCIVGDPWDESGRQYTRTTEPKIYRRTGGDWSVILDSAIIEATIPCTIQGSLLMRGPKGNINAEGHIYALVSFQRVAGNRYMLYFFWSDDYGDSWTAHWIRDNAFNRNRAEQLRVGAFQGSSPYAAGQVIYAVSIGGVPDQWYMDISIDQGVNWTVFAILLPHCEPGGVGGDLARSPANQDIIYWAGWGTGVGGKEYTLRKSINRGGVLTTLWACALTPKMTQRPGVQIWSPLSAFMAAGADGLHWTENDWADYVTYTNTDNFDVDGCSRVMDAPELLYGWQADDPGGGDMQHVIAVSDNRAQNWEGKAGDDPVTPSATSIPNDCGGVAGILQVWTEE